MNLPVGLEKGIIIASPSNYVKMLVNKDLDRAIRGGVVDVNELKLCLGQIIMGQFHQLKLDTKNMRIEDTWDDYVRDINKDRRKKSKPMLEILYTPRSGYAIDYALMHGHEDEIKTIETLARELSFSLIENGK